MALFHFHVGQVKRSKGQSAVAAAAYRAGEKLYSSYYNEFSDFTRKGGVICSEIFLPPQAPVEYKDRTTLWNAVEKAERGKTAQLAYSFDIALQNELTMEENIALARRFVQEQFVSRGMVADLAVHAPDKEDGGIPNPHFHVLCPIRPIEENGKWGNKQRRVYRLDEHGNRVLGENGKPLFDAVPTTDWGRPETLEAWRAAWADMVNSRFAEKGLDCRIDHRSYERQGSEQLPTIHEGVAVRQMEAKGIVTNKGEWNRLIRSTNAALANLRRKIRNLLAAIKAIREELRAPKEPDLVEVLSAYYHSRNAGAYTEKAKANNLKAYARTFAMLERENIYTLDALYARVEQLGDETRELNNSLKAKAERMKKLDTYQVYAREYQKLKPVYEHMNGLKFKRSREKYAAEHNDELDRFYFYRRKLKEVIPKGTPQPVKAWQAEHENLQREYNAGQAKLSPLWNKYKELQDVEIKLKLFQQDQERAARQKERPKRREAER